MLNMTFQTPDTNDLLQKEGVQYIEPLQLLIHAFMNSYRVI